MSKLPSMPFFPADFFADTRHLSWECQGLYLLMLMHAWLSDGKLPADEATLIRILRINKGRWNTLKVPVLPFWHTEDGFIFNQRLTKNFKEIAQKFESNKAHGFLGGRPKALISNESSKPRGYFSGTQTKGNQNQNQNYKEDSLNGEIRQEKGNPLFFVEEDTPQWNAWAEYWRASKGTVPSKVGHRKTHKMGWYFLTEWPPTQT